ncbi:MAG: sulfatase-like hydrolase/transferase [Planctomycetota bacterium]|nr:sulfatase-like hydrolase/transferase [Planctomycetota bacterium]
MRIRPWLVIAAAASAAAVFGPSCSLFAPDPPKNLLVIAVDGLRLDALRPALGAPKTPNIQRLAGSGIDFAWCFGHSSATLPATAALLTGRTPSSSRVRVDGQAIDGDVTLLQEHLRAAGWQTFGVFGSPDVRSQSPGQGIDRGFHLDRTHPHEAPPASEINGEIVPMLERANQDTPWFAFVQYADPTAPYASHGTADRTASVLVDGKQVDRIGTSDPGTWKRTIHVPPGKHTVEFRGDEDFVVERVDAFRGGTPLDTKAGRGVTGKTTRSFSTSFEAYGPVEAEIDLVAFVHDVPDLAESRSRYNLEVEAVDAAIGELVAALERNGQYDRTCIVLVAPHAESLGEHGQLGHGASLADSVLRVPLVIKPILNDGARAELAKRRLDVVRVIDLAPTLLEMFGEDRLPNAEGLSLLRGGERLVMAEVHPPQAPSSVLALRDERYKLVYTAGDDQFEMFDVKSDTLELDNIFALQGHFRSKWQAQLRDLAERAPHADESQVGAVR